MRLLALSITMTYSICFFIVFAKVCLTCSKKKSVGRPGDRKIQARISDGSKEKLAVKQQKSIDFTRMKEEKRTQAAETSPQRILVSKEPVQQKLTSKESLEERKFSASKESEVVGSKEVHEKPPVKNERDEHMGGYLSAGPDDRAFTLLMPVAPVQEKTEGKSMFGEVIDPLKENNKNQSSQQENEVEVEPILGEDQKRR